MHILDFILSMKVKSYIIEYYLWFKWKDESINLKYSFSGELFKTQVKMIFNFCLKFCTVCLWIQKLV